MPSQTTLRIFNRRYCFNAKADDQFTIRFKPEHNPVSPEPLKIVAVLIVFVDLHFYGFAVSGEGLFLCAANVDFFGVA